MQTPEVTEYTPAEIQENYRLLVSVWHYCLHFCEPEAREMVHPGRIGLVYRPEISAEMIDPIYEAARQKWLSIECVQYRFKQTIRDLLRQMDNMTDEETNFLEPSCNACTQGATPLSFDRGLCAYHRAKQIVEVA